MTDLPEFLLARIAEDEAEAQQWPDDRPPPPNGDPLWVDTLGHPIYQPRSRVLAECEAKRRIVEFMVNEAKDARRRPGWTIPAADLTNDVDRAYRTGVENQKAQQLPDALDRTDRLLRLLAMPYADHPDYRPEWKPQS